MTLNQLHQFGMVCVDFYFKVLPIFMLFSRCSQKRSHPALRLAAAVPALLLYSYLLVQIPQPNSGDIYLFFLFILLFVGLFLFGRFFYDASAYTVLFNILGGYALNQILLLMLNLLRLAIPPLGALHQATVAYYSVELVWFTVTYALCDVLFLRKMTQEPTGQTDRPRLYISLGISLFLIEFNLVRNLEIERGGKIDILCILCIILFYILILILRSGILLRMEKEKELALREQVWAEKEKSLQLTREAVETINIKYHDLRHIASRIRRGKDVLDLADSLTESLERYERSYATGNDTLDMILTDEHRRFHGFGMRSIQSTVDKYGGTMDIDTNEGRFKLMIMIPMPDAT